MKDLETVRFYWSFRSPYAWLAVHRIDLELQDLGVQLDWIPIYPPQDPAAFPNNPTNNPAKVRYIAQDVQRFARAYDLPLSWPQKIDTDWRRPHAAFLYAQAHGRGPVFARECYDARFSRGHDVGTDEVLGEVAKRVGLDAGAVVSAADDPALRERLANGIREAFSRGVFGVPTFVYRDEMFWGNDRIEWLTRAVRQGQGNQT